MVGLLLSLAACTTQSPQPTPQFAPAYEAGVDLPAGPGRELLVASCLSCHELRGLALFKGFYTRDLWRSLVVTMAGYGAPVDEAEIEILAGYLGEHFGPETR